MLKLAKLGSKRPRNIRVPQIPETKIKSFQQRGKSSQLCKETATNNPSLKERNDQKI